MSARSALIRSVFTVAALSAVAACHDGLLHEPARVARAEVALSASLAGGSLMLGGPTEAYAQTNTLYVEFISDDEQPRFQRTIPFDPTAAEVRATFDVPLQDVTENLWFRIEIRRGADAVFYGSNEITLTAGEVTAAAVALEPFVWDVTCSGPQIDFDAYGLTTRLFGVPVFVTGDTIPGLNIFWTTNSNAVTVDQTGVIEAVSDGNAEVYCIAGNGLGMRPVRVFAAVDFITIDPFSADITVGGTQAFIATAHDRFENVIAGRTFQWGSGNPAVASVTQSGVATGVAAGQTVITARIDSIVDAASITVR